MPGDWRRLDTPPTRVLCSTNTTVILYNSLHFLSDANKAMLPICYCLCRYNQLSSYTILGAAVEELLLVLDESVRGATNRRINDGVK